MEEPIQQPNKAKSNTEDTEITETILKMPANRKRNATKKESSNGDIPKVAKVEKEENLKHTPMDYPAPFDEDKAAVDTRNLCDYSIKIKLEDAKDGNVPRRVRVYADGIYDMFHSGHARQLMQVKQLIPNAYLIVGVCNDDLTMRNKGRTVMKEHERYEAVRHCRYVDELITSAPWSYEDDFLNYHKIDFIAHDDLPYCSAGSTDTYADIKARGMFLATQRTEGISTTDVISRILRDYDMYVRRNLSRGMPRTELNVSYLRAKRIEVEGKLEEMKGKTSETLRDWEGKSRDFVQSFVEMFHNPGTVVNEWISEGSRRVRRALSPPASPRLDIVESLDD